MNPQQIEDILQLIYREWNAAIAIRLDVSAQKDDGSPDWQEFHDAQLANAKSNETRWAENFAAFRKDHF